MIEVLNIDKNLFDIEAKLDVFEMLVEQADKIELKKEIQIDINKLKSFLIEHPEEDEDGQISSSLKIYEKFLN